MDTLTDDAVRGNRRCWNCGGWCAQWHGHAAVDEAGHWLVRDFRRIVMLAVLNPALRTRAAACEPGLAIGNARGSGGRSNRSGASFPRGRRGCCRRRMPSWDALLLRAAEITTRLGEREGGLALRDCVWGRRNTLAMRHPISVRAAGVDRAVAGHARRTVAGR